MGRPLILDTTFIIDLERERRRESLGPASSFLERNPEDELVITETIVGDNGLLIGSNDLWIAAAALAYTFTAVDVELAITSSAVTSAPRSCDR